MRSALPGFQWPVDLCHKPSSDKDWCFGRQRRCSREARGEESLVTVWLSSERKLQVVDYAVAARQLVTRCLP